jgi:hypothetical protein
MMLGRVNALSERWYQIAGALTAKSLQFTPSCKMKFILGSHNLLEDFSSVAKG